MELGRRKEGVLMHIPLVAAYITNRKKENKNHFEKGGHFLHKNFMSCFSKKGRISPPCHSNNALTTACSQWETAKTLKSWSFLSKLLFKATLLSFRLKSNKANHHFISSVLSMVPHSLLVPNFNFLVFLNTRFAGKRLTILFLRMKKNSSNSTKLKKDIRFIVH